MKGRGGGGEKGGAPAHGRSRARRVTSSAGLCLGFSYPSPPVIDMSEPTGWTTPGRAWQRPARKAARAHLL